MRRSAKWRGRLSSRSLIIIIVFLPLFSLEQMEGKMFKPLAMTMCFAMLGSLLVALTIVPVLCSLFLRGHKDEPRQSRHPPREAGLPAGAFAGAPVPMDHRGRRRRHLRRHPGAGSAAGHRVPAATGRGRHRHQRGAAALRVAGRLGRRGNGDRTAPSHVPGGQDRRHQDRARGNLRGSHGAGAERSRDHAASRRTNGRPGGPRKPLWPRCRRNWPPYPGCACRSPSPLRCASTN